MDFELTGEQRLLRDSVERLVADHYGFDKRRTYLAQRDGWRRTLWAQYAELGLLGLPFAEDYGGVGGGPAPGVVGMGGVWGGLARPPPLCCGGPGGGAPRPARRPAP